MPVWNPSLTPSTNQYSFMAVAMHELGHAAGANHEARMPNLMGLIHGGILPGGKTTTAYHLPGTKDKNSNELAIPIIGADFTNGITNAHGIDPAKKENVSISPWKGYGSVADCDTIDPNCKPKYYSLHSRVGLISDNNGNQIATVENKPDPTYMRSDPVYALTKNMPYKANFMYENTGKSPVLTVRWRAYVSTDAVLDTALDRPIVSSFYGEGDLTIDRKLKSNGDPGGPMPNPLPFKLPTDLSSGTPYYLFIMLDPPPTDPSQKNIDEANELDKFTYVKIIPL